LLVSASRAWNLLNDDEKAYRIARRIISEYPEFGAEQIDVVKNYYILKQDTAGYVKELRSIIQQKAHPNLIEKARKALKEFEEKVEESPDTSGVIE
jgi:hypothetical protein